MLKIKSLFIFSLYITISKCQYYDYSYDGAPDYGGSEDAEQIETSFKSESSTIVIKKVNTSVSS